MGSKSSTKSIVISALLCALGIIIPMFSPIKIILEPASFTLASHVAIFIAMFISPSTALFVTLGTTIGFLLGGFPIVVVLRALSHLVFVSIGSIYLKRNNQVIKSIKSSLGYSFMIGLVHAICEVLIVIPFYFGSKLSTGYYEQGFVISVLLLVGIGTIVHSMLDFGLSVYIWNLMPKEFRNISTIKDTVKA
jgi:niacin transporter